MLFRGSTPTYGVPQAQPQCASSFCTHGTGTPRSIRSPGGRPISRMRTPGSCRCTSSQQFSRYHWIPRWLVGVMPLPMNPIFAVRRKAVFERSRRIAVFLFKMRNARMGMRSKL